MSIPNSIRVIRVQANVLIDEDNRPRIADFGLTKIIDSQITKAGGTTQRGKGSVRWKAPELLAFDEEEDDIVPTGLTSNSDVYAFGCVCIEVPIPAPCPAKILTMD